jgi:hypothetical protein
VLIFAKRGWALVQASRVAYDQWKRLPDAERERTKESAERVRVLGVELSTALGAGVVNRVKRGPQSGKRETDVIARELQAALAELAAGPGGELALNVVRPKGISSRIALKAAKATHKRVAAKDPKPALEPPRDQQE